MPSQKFYVRVGLLILLVAGLFAVSVTMVLNKHAATSSTIEAIGRQTSGSADSASAVVTNPNVSTSATRTDATNAPVVTGQNAEPRQQITSSSPLVPGEWIIVDCVQRIVTRCPHALDANGRTPEYPASSTTPVYRNRCRDVSINIDSFCTN